MDSAKDKLKRFWSSLWEVLEVVLISVATVFIIRQFIAQPFLVSGASMEPNFSDGHYLIIDEVTYRFRDPQRGEVIVFRYPAEPKTFFIKRIIGLPGDRVAVKNNIIKISSDSKEVPLQETYLLQQNSTVGNSVIELKDSQYFVLGDNRYNSFDSRSWGPIAKKDIVGLARLRLFPINKLGLIQAPAY